MDMLANLNYELLGFIGLLISITVWYLIREPSISNDCKYYDVNIPVKVLHFKKIGVKRRKIVNGHSVVIKNPEILMTIASGILTYACK